MSIAEGPPVLPPQVSPDGKWIWDGHEWQPLPEVIWEPAAEAVIPQAVAVAAPVERRGQTPPVERDPPPEALSYPAARYPIPHHPVGAIPPHPLLAEPARARRANFL